VLQQVLVDRDGVVEAVVAGQDHPQVDQRLAPQRSGAGRPGKDLLQQERRLRPAAELHQLGRRLDLLLLGTVPPDGHDRQHRHPHDQRQHQDRRQCLHQPPAGVRLVAQQSRPEHDHEEPAGRVPEPPHPRPRLARLEQRGHVQERRRRVRRRRGTL
jgi:hypothetical protein